MVVKAMHIPAKEINPRENVASNTQRHVGFFDETIQQSQMPKKGVSRSNVGLLKQLAIESVSDNCMTCPCVQAKLIIGQSGDKFEREADCVAREIMRDSDSDLNSTFSGQKQKKIGAIKAEQSFKPLIPISDKVEQQIYTLKNGGQPLAKPLRSFFENRFGTDFSQVRIHCDNHSQETAHALNAKAFTFKNHVVLGRNQYLPETFSGKLLLAHELTHVLQQENGYTRIQRTPEEDWERDNRIGQVERVSRSHIVLWNFQVNSHQLKQAHQHALRLFLRRPSVWMALRAGPRSIHFDGYTSSSGSERLNQSLSEWRAFEAKSYALLAPEGLRFDAQKFIDQGFGISHVPPNDTPENMARNRRVDVYIPEQVPRVEEPEEPDTCTERWAFGDFEIDVRRIIPHGQASGFIIEKAEGVLSHKTGGQSATWESRNCRYIGMGGVYDIWDILVDLIKIIARKFTTRFRDIPGARSIAPVVERIRDVLRELGVEVPENIEDWIYEEFHEDLENQYLAWRGAETWDCKVFCENILWDDWETGGCRYGGPAFEFNPVFGSWEVVFNFNTALPSITNTYGIGQDFIQNKEEIREKVEDIKRFLDRIRPFIEVLRIIHDEPIEDIVEAVDTAEETLDVIIEVIDWCSYPEQTHDWILTGNSSQCPPDNMTCTLRRGPVGGGARESES